MGNILDTHAAAYQGGNPYDFDNEILLNWYPQRVLLHSKDAGSILELGLGHGFTTKLFANSFSRHLVLEGSQAVIRNFTEKFPDCPAQIIETCFEKFSTSARFDVIVMGFILEHVDDPLAILRSYGKFLTPSGKMFVAVPNAEVLNRRLGQIAGMLDDVHTLSENDRLLGHKRYFTVATLTDAVNQAGFRIARLEGIYLKPFTSSQIVSLQLDRSIIRSLCEVGVDYPELSCGILAEISLR